MVSEWNVAKQELFLYDEINGQRGKQMEDRNLSK